MRISSKSLDTCPKSADVRVRFALAIDVGRGHRATTLNELKTALNLDPDHATAGGHLASLLF